MSIVYLLKIDGIKGDSKLANFTDYFSVDDFNFNITRGPTGLPVFSPLGVDLTSSLGSLLYQQAVNGKHLAAIELVGVTGGDSPQTVYDLTLNDVTIKSLDGNFASFGFGEIGLKTSVENDVGGLLTQSFGYDLRAAKEIGALTGPGGGTTHGDAATPTAFFLKIDGIKGDSKLANFTDYFSVDHFNFGVSTGANGLPVFSPLSVDLTSSLGSLLYQQAVNGKHLAAIELVGVTGGDSPQTVYDLTLNDVTIKSLDGDFASFGFGKIGLKTSVENDVGGLLTQSFGYDLRAAKEIGALTGPGGGTTHGDAATPTAFFLKIDGIKGDSKLANFTDYFSVDHFNFGVSTGANGLPVFSPLSVDLTSSLGSLLYQQAVNGKHLAAIELVGVTGGDSPQTVYDLTLNDVTISLDGDFASFGFGKIGLKTSVENDVGGLLTQSFGYDLRAAKEIGALTGPGGGTTHGDAATPTAFFLKIDGIKGDSKLANFTDYFSVDHFNFNVTRGPTGLPVFSQLGVDLTSSLGSLLYQQAVNGKHLAAIELVGVTGGDSPQTVYDLTLNDVTIKSLDGDFASFGFGEIGLKTSVENDVGGLLTQSFGYDLRAAKEIGALTGPGGGTTHGDAATPTAFFLKIDGIKGDSVNAKFQDYFDVDFYNLGVSTGANGLPVFSPLSVDLTSSLGSLLYQQAVNGKHLAAIELVGVTGGDSPQTVYDLTLNDVTIKSLDGNFASFGFGKIGLKTSVENDVGGLLTQSFGYDLRAAKEIGALTGPGGGTTHGDAATPTAFFLKIDGVKGDSVNAKFQDYFDVDFYNFGVSTGANGLPVFSPLFLNLPFGSHLPDFLHDLAANRHLHRVELVGTAGGAESQIVLDLVIADATVARVLDYVSPVDTLSFTFTRIELETSRQDDLGNPTSTTFIKGMIAGGSANDILEGTIGADWVFGRDGDDILRGSAGADVLDGEAGFDTADYSLAAAAVVADLVGTAGTTGHAMGDKFFSVERVLGTKFNDTLRGDGNDNTLDGGAGGGDTLVGRDGADKLIGGIGNDTLDGGSGGDVLDGGDGVDTASYASATAGVLVTFFFASFNTGDAAGDSYVSIENVTGSNFVDNLQADDLVNVLKGRGGDDTLVGRGGADVLDGGPGSDTASYYFSPGPITVDLGKPRDNTGEAIGDSYISIENLQGSEAFSDVLRGNASANILWGAQGDDTLYGLGGNDTLNGENGDDVLIGGAGADALDGGDGKDTASYAGSSVAVTVNLNAGTGSGGDAQGDTLTGIENLIGSAFNDALTGDAGNNVLTGGAGNDMLIGGIGNDTLDGGAGTADTASYATAGSGVTVNLALAGPQDTVGAGVDSLIGIERLIGSASNDTLTGDLLANRIDGGAGDDTVDGGAGNDILIGGANSATGDTVSYASSAAAVTVSLAIQDGVTAQNTVGAGTDTLSGFENLIGSALNDKLTGSSLANVLAGGTGDDLINGGAGNDTLEGEVGIDTLKGGAGNDMLTGGTDADKFVFDTALNALTNVDDITDFELGIDQTVLENSIFTKLAAIGTLSDDFFHVGTGAADSNDFIIYDDTTGALYYDSNGSAAGQQVQFAHLDPSLTLTHADFFVV